MQLYLGPIGFSIYTPELDLANLTDVWVLSKLSQCFTHFMKNLKFMNSINSTALDYNPATDDEWLHLHKERIKNFYISLMTRSLSTMIARESILLPDSQ